MLPGAFLSHKSLADALACWVHGSRDLINGNEVAPPLEISDNEVTEAVRLALEKDPLLNADAIGVIAQIAWPYWRVAWSIPVKGKGRKWTHGVSSASIWSSTGSKCGSRKGAPRATVESGRFPTPGPLTKLLFFLFLHFDC